MTAGILTLFSTGDEGKVEESMKEMAAIEALKGEKAEKEVCIFVSRVNSELMAIIKPLSVTFNNCQILLAHPATKNFASVMFVVHICQSWTPTVG